MELLEKVRRQLLDFDGEYYVIINLDHLDAMWEQYQAAGFALSFEHLVSCVNAVADCFRSRPPEDCHVTMESTQLCWLSLAGIMVASCGRRLRRSPLKLKRGIAPSAASDLYVQSLGPFISRFSTLQDVTLELPGVAETFRASCLALAALPRLDQCVISFVG